MPKMLKLLPAPVHCIELGDKTELGVVTDRAHKRDMVMLEFDNFYRFVFDQYASLGRELPGISFGYI